MSYARSFGAKVLAFRFFNVFGPYQRADHAYAAVIPAFIAAALEGKPLTVHGDGTQTRDFTYVGDVDGGDRRRPAREVTLDSPVNLAFSTEHIAVRSDRRARGACSVVRSRVTHGPSRGGDVHDSQARLLETAGVVPVSRTDAAA